MHAIPKSKKNAPAALPVTPAVPVSQAAAFVDNRARAVEERALAVKVNNSARLLQQKAVGAAIRAMPRTTAPHAAVDARPHAGLPAQLKAGIESLSGVSMEHVKVLYNSSQPARLNARAYAQGNEIHLGPGQEAHLPHEAWHVVQQQQGRVKPTRQLKGELSINDDTGLEKEADVMGAKAVLAGQAAAPSAPLAMPYAPTLTVQRLVTVEEDNQAITLQIFRSRARLDAASDVALQRFIAEKGTIEFASVKQGADICKRVGRAIQTLDLLEGERKRHYPEPIVPAGWTERARQLKEELVKLMGKNELLGSITIADLLTKTGELTEEARLQEAGLGTKAGYKEAHPEAYKFYVQAKAALKDAEPEADRATLKMHDRIELDIDAPPELDPEIADHLQKIDQALHAAQADISKLTVKVNNKKRSYATRAMQYLIELRKKHAIVSARRNGIAAARGAGGFKKVGERKSAKAEKGMSELLPDLGKHAELAEQAKVVGMARNTAYLQHYTERREEERAIDHALRAAEKQGIASAWKVRLIGFDDLAEIAPAKASASGLIFQSLPKDMLFRGECEYKINQLQEAVVDSVQDPLMKPFAEERRILQAKERVSSLEQTIVDNIGDALKDKLAQFPGVEKATDDSVKETKKAIGFRAAAPPAIGFI